MTSVSGDWLDQYVSALSERDTSEQAHKHYIDAYTRLADRTASSARPSPTVARDAIEQETAKTTDTAAADSAALEQLRADLATTQKARTTLAAQVSDLTASLTALQVQKKEHQNQVANLTRQNFDIERKLRDRDEELRGKLRLVQEAQDEMIALQLQLYMAEQKKEALEKENKELVDRWMKRMGQEAEQVNRTSKWT